MILQPGGGGGGGREGSRSNCDFLVPRYLFLTSTLYTVYLF